MLKTTYENGEYTVEWNFYNEFYIGRGKTQEEATINCMKNIREKND